MEIVEFKSKRLFWLVYLIPTFAIMYDAPYSYYIQDGIIHCLRGVLSVGGLLGCFFYALGIKIFSSNFWKVYFVLMLLDEMYGFVTNSVDAFTASGFDIFVFIISLLFIVPAYFILFMYAFKNAAIWKQRFI